MATRLAYIYIARRGARLLPGNLPPHDAVPGWPPGRPLPCRSTMLRVLRGSPSPSGSGWPLGPALTLPGEQGRVPRGSPSTRLRLGHPACLYSSLRCKAAAHACNLPPLMRFRAGLPASPYLLPECKAARFTRLAKLDAAQARAPRPAYSALRMRGCCPGSFPPRDAALGCGLSAGLYLIGQQGRV